MHAFPPAPRLSVSSLAACFNNTTATYKFYWMLAILESIQSGRREIKKRELFAHMMANAWYTVNYFHVSFGPHDLIQDTVKQLKDIEGLTVEAQRILVHARLTASENLNTIRLLNHFDKNVPHWFLSPWYPKQDKSSIYRLSQENENQPLYHLYSDKIIIHEQWFEYLVRHLRIIRDYVYWNLALFLQVRNPNVPDIPHKLIKPAARTSLSKQRKFWDFVLDTHGPVQCIYTGKTLAKGSYHVEHFVPYSFVSHDQIWNLIPADNAFNLAKNNKLPPLETYFEPFYGLQTLAIETYLKNKPNDRLLEDYYYIGADLSGGLPRDRFYDVINPLVTIAANSGFEFLT